MFIEATYLVLMSVADISLKGLTFESFGKQTHFLTALTMSSTGDIEPPFPSLQSFPGAEKCALPHALVPLQFTLT